MSIFIITYLVLSLPYIFGFGFTIDFVKGTHPFWIIYVYIKDGLIYRFFEKSIISILESLCILLFLKIKK